MAETPEVSRSPPIGLKWRSHTLFILTTVGIGIFTDLFLYGLIVPVLPFLLREKLHVPDHEIQFRVDEMLAVYAGGSVIFAPVAGYIADNMSSRQIPFLSGLFSLFAATILLAVGETLPVLYAARLLQGLSAAVVWPVGLALTMDTVGAEKLGTAIGSMFTFVTAGTLIAPTVGGSLYTHIGYFGVIAVGGAVLVVDFIMRLILIEKRVAAQYLTEERTRNEYEHNRGTQNQDRGVSGEANEACPLLQTTKLSDYHISPNQWSWVQKFPFLYYLSNASLLASLLITMVQGIIYGSFDATLPTFTKDLFGFSSSQAGLMFICLGVTDMISGPIVGWMVDRYGTKAIGTTAYIYLAGGLISLRAITSNTREQLVLYCILLAFCGVGLGLISTPALVEAGTIVKRYYDPNPDFFGGRPPYAQLYELCSTMYMVGLTLGPLAAGSMKGAIGYGNMAGVLGAICAATAAVAWYFMGEKQVDAKKLEDCTENRT